MDGGGEGFWPADSGADFLADDLVRPHRDAEEAFGGIVETGEGGVRSARVGLDRKSVV